MDEDEKKDADVTLPDGVLDDVLEEETEEDELLPALGLDEFGAGIEGEEKQWE